LEYYRYALGINQNEIVELKEVLNNNKGKTELKFIIFEKEKNIWIDMFSRNTSINFNKEIKQQLQNLIFVEELKIN